MDEISHKLCLVQRENLHEVSNSVRVTPITPYVQSKLAIALRNTDSDALIELYRTFAVAPSYRGMTGVVFEAFCQNQFQKRIVIECLPMVRPDDHGSKRKSQFRTSHSPFLSNKKLEERRQAALQEGITLDVHPSATFVYSGLDLAELQLQRDVYYIPNKMNEAGLDSFIWHDEHMYIFQFTVGKKHSINEGLIQRFVECTELPSRPNWRFIFVIPDDVPVLTCPSPTDPELREVGMLSTIVAMKEYLSRIMGESGDETQHRELAAPSVRLKRKAGDNGDEEPVLKKAKVPEEPAQGSSTRTRRSTRKGKEKMVD
jgi:hypothetical protein